MASFSRTLTFAEGTKAVIDSGPEGIVYDSNSCEIRWEIPKDQPRGRGERHFPPHRLDPRGDLSHRENCHSLILATSAPQFRIRAEVADALGDLC